MLVDKNTQIAPSDIVSIRTLSGEEIVGRFVSASPSEVLLSRPMVLGSRMKNEVEMEVGFLPMPLMASVDDATPLAFPMSALTIKPVRTKADVAGGYVQYTTGLAIPTAQQASAILRP